MANKKEKVPFPVPSSGVRNDVNRLVQTGEMASIGDNCLFFDGTIRPRPSLTKEIDDPVGGRQLVPQYQEVYDAGNVGYDRRGTAFVETSNGVMLAAYVDSTSYNGDKWAMSVDGGQNWSYDVALDKVDGGTRTPDWMFEVDGYLFASTDGSALYRAPVSTLPSSLTWETLATGMTDMNPNGLFLHYQYDYEHDALIIADNSSLVVWVVYDITAASGPWTKENIIPDGTDFVESTANRLISPGGLCGNWYVVPCAYDTTAPANSYVEQWLTAYPIEWDGSTYNIDLDSGVSKLMVSNSYNPYPVGGVASSRFGTAVFDGGVDAAGSKCIFLISASGQDFEAEIYLDSTGFIDSSLKYTPVDTWGGQVITYVRTESSLMALAYTGKSEYPFYRFPNLLTSVDGGATWMRFIADEHYIDEKEASDAWPDGEPMVSFMHWTQWRLSINDTDGRVFLFGHCSYDDWNPVYKEYDHPKAYLAPNSQGGGALGSATTVFQANMDDEDDTVILGTTKAWARLDRDTNLWTRITASDTETVDGDNAGGSDGDWNDGGAGTGYDADIPPLSSYPDDTSYVSGVSIDGVYGDHPWVFRTFEASGETYLIGTNGQCYPLIYHPDMPGGFARRLGEMTIDDPNYVANPTNGSALGDLAPKAKCIAVAANRVVLANDPSGTGSEVSVGGWNDPDRSWGEDDFQFVLLTDTPGKIISMNEISALQVAIYKEDAIYHAISQTEFLNVSAPFRFELSKAGISGPCSPNSVLRNFDGRQIYLARDGGVYMYDGVAPLDGGRNIRRLIQDDIDLNKLGRAWGMVDNKRKLVWFFYPTKSGFVNSGIVISTDQGYPWPCWKVNLPSSWNFVTGAQITLTDDISLGELKRLDSYSDDVTLASFSSGQSEMLMGLQNCVFFSQKYDDDSASYDDDGVPIGIHLRTGWITPAGLEVSTADTIHHVFSCVDPEQELLVRLRAQQLGRNIRESKASSLSSGKRQRRTKHRVSGVQFSLDIQGAINRSFNWGGGIMSYKKRGGR